MKIYHKNWQTTVPGSMKDVWDFFSDPGNLQRITPDDMDFQILTDLKGLTMYQGMLIRYKVSPFAGIRMNWVTEITSVRQHSYFIDEQRFGPYALWHHEHRFESTTGGVLMTDNLHYALPLGILGQIANKIMVGKRIDHIFEFRQNIIKEIFRPKMPAMESTSK